MTTEEENAKLQIRLAAIVDKAEPMLVVASLLNECLLLSRQQAEFIRKLQHDHGKENTHANGGTIPGSK
jgi:ATP-dependent Clp protease adapter protein ClpS